jgi:hypothetical protein
MAEVIYTYYEIRIKYSKPQVSNNTTRGANHPVTQLLNYQMKKVPRCDGGLFS